MRVRRAEQREQGVADELVDEAAELLHRSGQFLEQLVLKRLHDLGVELFAERREAAEVGEQDGDGAPVGLVIDLAFSNPRPSDLAGGKDLFAQDVVDAGIP